jgi:hypothetical protein
MNKNKIVFSIIALVILFVLKGCILDAFDTLTQNIPISKEFTVQGTGSVSSPTNFCLTESEVIEDYRGKIENIELVTATYQTISISPANTKGNITISLAESDGTELYSYTLTNVSPAAYINNPFVLTITPTQLQLLNAYLGTLKEGTCFRATLSISIIEPSGTTITLVGKVDIAFKMKTGT